LVTTIVTAVRPVMLLKEVVTETPAQVANRLPPHLVEPFQVKPLALAV
jgi:hypothetical protein